LPHSATTTTRIIPDKNGKAALRGAHLTACDVDRDGADFCAATFGATPAYGHNSLREIWLQGNFDLVWVG
jgi:hypothetical protein